jgi:hypothetical protein
MPPEPGNQQLAVVLEGERRRPLPSASRSDLLGRIPLRQELSHPIKMNGH